MKTTPSLSIVIPTFNARHLLEKHLPSLDSVLKKGDELVIVDDASTDDTVQWLATQKPHFHKKGIELIVVVHSQNQRFAAAVNSGVQAAHHDWVWLLNNDVSPVAPDIRQRLFAWTPEPNLFAVGCAEITSLDKQQQISGRGTGRFARGLFVHWYDPNQTDNRTLWTSGGSMFFNRAKYLEIGGMDTLFYPAYEEDRDLSYRALKHGWKLFFDHTCVVLHQHETTNTTVFGQKKMAIVSWKNQFLIVWKNISDWKLLIQHLAWLPYHLTLSQWRSGGVVWPGLWNALQQFPQMLRSRQVARKFWNIPDDQIVFQFSLPQTRINDTHKN